jgi:hypothetical protein
VFLKITARRNDCIYMCVYIYMYIYMCIYIYICIYMYMCVCVLCVCVRACVCRPTCIYFCALLISFLPYKIASLKTVFTDMFMIGISGESLF